MDHTDHTTSSRSWTTRVVGLTTSAAAGEAAEAEARPEAGVMGADDSSPPPPPPPPPLPSSPGPAHATRESSSPSPSPSPPPPPPPLFPPPSYDEAVSICSSAAAAAQAQAQAIQEASHVSWGRQDDDCSLSPGVGSGEVESLSHRSISRTLDPILVVGSDANSVEMPTTTCDVVVGGRGGAEEDDHDDDGGDEDGEATTNKPMPMPRPFPLFAESDEGVEIPTTTCEIFEGGNDEEEEEEAATAAGDASAVVDEDVAVSDGRSADGSEESRDDDGQHIAVKGKEDGPAKVLAMAPPPAAASEEDHHLATTTSTRPRGRSSKLGRRYSWCGQALGGGEAGEHSLNVPSRHPRARSLDPAQTRSSGGTSSPRPRRWSGGSSNRFSAPRSLDDVLTSVDDALRRTAPTWVRSVSETDGFGGGGRKSVDEPPTTTTSRRHGRGSFTLSLLGKSNSTPSVMLDSDDTELKSRDDGDDDAGRIPSRRQKRRDSDGSDANGTADGTTTANVVFSAASTDMAAQSSTLSSDLASSPTTNDATERRQQQQQQIETLTCRSRRHASMTDMSSLPSPQGKVPTRRPYARSSSTTTLLEPSGDGDGDGGGGGRRRRPRPYARSSSMDVLCQRIATTGGGDGQSTPLAARLPPRRRSILTVRTVEESLGSSEAGNARRDVARVRRAVRRNSSFHSSFGSMSNSVHSGRSSSDGLSPAKQQSSSMLSTQSTASDAAAEQAKAASSVRNSSSTADDEAQQQQQTFDAVDVLSVSFHSIELRSYPLAIGDHPCVSSGPPVSLSWEPVSSEVVHVDEYERRRSESGGRRKAGEMFIPAAVRSDALREEGYSRGQINESAKKAREDRRAMAKGLRRPGRAILSKTEEILERSKRSVRNVLHRKKKRDERELLKKGAQLDQELEKARAEEAAAEMEEMEAIALAAASSTEDAAAPDETKLAPNSCS